MAAATLIVYLQSQLQSNDALFLVISNNIWVNVSLLALSCSLVWLSFQSEYKQSITFIVSVLGAVLLTAGGFAGILSASLEHYVIGAIKPLDYILLFEAGILLSICSLSYKHPAISFSIKLPRLPVYRLRHYASNLLAGPADGSRTSKPSAA